MVSSSTTVGVLPDVIKAIAVYEVDSNKIKELYSTWLAPTQSTVSNCYYSTTRLDGNRTLAVRYTATLRNTAGISQSFSIYAEFGTSGGGWMSISYL